MSKSRLAILCLAVSLGIGSFFGISSARAADCTYYYNQIGRALSTGDISAAATYQQLYRNCQASNAAASQAAAIAQAQAEARARANAQAAADRAAADRAAADKAAADRAAADKAAADKAAADKAAADKAAADKAAADKAAADKAAAADEARNSAYAATDAALAAADVADATRAANEDALADSDGADLAKISLQREKLDVAYISATTALANVTTAYDNARAQVVKFQALMNAATDASEKQALATALSKLANATLTLSGSRSKLVGQMNVLDAKKSFLLSAEEKLLTKAKVGGASTSSAKPVIKEKIIVCTKGKSSLKVIGKNPKCPAGYKKK